MEDMDEKNKRMQLERANNKKLCDKVQELVVGRNSRMLRSRQFNLQCQSWLLTGFWP